MGVSIVGVDGDVVVVVVEKAKAQCGANDQSGSKRHRDVKANFMATKGKIIATFVISILGKGRARKGAASS